MAEKNHNPLPISIDGARSVTPEKQWSIFHDPRPVFNVFVKAIHYGFIEGKFYVWYTNYKDENAICDNSEIINLFQTHFYNNIPLKIVVYPPGIVLFYTNNKILATLDMTQCVNVKKIVAKDLPSDRCNLSSWIEKYGDIKYITSKYHSEEWCYNAVHTGQIYFENHKFDLNLNSDFSSNKLVIQLGIS